MNSVSAASQAPETGTFITMSRRQNNNGKHRQQPRAAAARSRRRTDRRQIAWLTLAVVLALLANLVISLNVYAASLEDAAELKVKTTRSAAPNGRTEQFGIKPSISVDVNEYLTVGLGNEYQLVKTNLDEFNTVSTEGFISTEFFLRGKLKGNDWYRLSIQDLVRMPGQDHAPGFSQADASLRLQYGRSGRLGAGSWYSNVTSGFHPELNHAPDKLQADMAVGWKPSRKWNLVAQSLNTVALGGETGAGMPVSGIDSSKGQVTVVRHLTKAVSVQVGGWQMMKSDGAGPSNGFDLAVWLRY